MQKKTEQVMIEDEEAEKDLKQYSLIRFSLYVLIVYLCILNSDE